MHAQAHHLPPPSAYDAVQISVDGLSVFGTGEPGGSATVYDAHDQIIGHCLCDPCHGLFDLTLSKPLAPGSRVRVDLCSAEAQVSSHELDFFPGESSRVPTGAMVTRRGNAVIGLARPGSALRLEHPNGQTVTGQADPHSGVFRVPLDPPLCHGELVSVFAESGHFIEWLSDSAPLTEPDESRF